MTNDELRRWVYKTAAFESPVVDAFERIYDEHKLMIEALNKIALMYGAENRAGQIAEDAILKVNRA